MSACASSLHEKFELAYPITQGLATLLEQAMTDSRWDMTYLAMQVLIEGLALAAFQRIRDDAKNPLAVAINAYVMQDEARHAAFGWLALRDYYCCCRTRSVMNARSSWWTPAGTCARGSTNLTYGTGWPACPGVHRNPGQIGFHEDAPGRLFSRIVPSMRDIGLWGPRVQQAFEQMGAMQFASVNTVEMLDNDSLVANAFDARMRVRPATDPDSHERLQSGSAIEPD